MEETLMKIEKHDKKIVIETMEKMYVENDKGNKIITLEWPKWEFDYSEKRTSVTEQRKFTVFDIKPSDKLDDENLQEAWDFVLDTYEKPFEEEPIGKVFGKEYGAFRHFITPRKMIKIEEQVDMSSLMEIFIGAAWDQDIPFSFWVNELDSEMGRDNFYQRSLLLYGAEKIEKEISDYCWNLLEDDDLNIRRKGLIRSAVLFNNKEDFANKLVEYGEKAMSNRERFNPKKELEMLIINNQVPIEENDNRLWYSDRFCFSRKEIFEDYFEN